MKRLILLLPVIALSSGCLTFLSDAFTPQVNISPDAWVPRMESGDGSEVVAEETNSPSRLLKPKDGVVINMTVSLRPQPRIEDIIDEEGNITLPILGEFMIAGLTTADAERAIKKAYLDSSVYRDLTVNVICTTRDPLSERSYSITGAVRKRGRCVLTNGLTLREAIIAAGDASDFANGKILITRKGVTKRFNYRRIRKGVDPDPLIMHGDIIEVCQ